MRVRISRNVLIPNAIKLERFRKSPELGPKILFFSGGTALRGLSRKLILYTGNSIHIITAFDSGGSSAKLREAFHMPAVGDVRARLMDLADQSHQGNPEVYELFNYRLPKNIDQRELANELDYIVKGRHRLIRVIPDPMRKIIRNHLFRFQQAMPEEFDLAGASIGNLILTAGYLENRRHLDPVIYIFSQLVWVRGTVRPIANKYLHLAAELEDGSLIVGQHLMTGKETAPLTTRIKRIFLTNNHENPAPYLLKLRKKVKKLISEAELICYPMGSFFSSILVNLEVNGVCTAIATTDAPKIYVPNTDADPECIGYTLMDQVEAIMECGRRENMEITPDQLITFVLVDRKNGKYPGSIDADYFALLGIELIDCALISPGSEPLIDDNLLLPVLLSLC
ncbi:MAG: GAK system CofD-like protein [Proteobacteria bacterium]|nr:GAK system CofD-like protein [Pseudomonadota bacterium]MBU1736833.1 GAK system CofD-like protein [Pseudomonadota bacterium]